MGNRSLVRQAPEPVTAEVVFWAKVLMAHLHAGLGGTFIIRQAA